MSTASFTISNPVVFSAADSVRSFRWDPADRLDPAVPPLPVSRTVQAFLGLPVDLEDLGILACLSGRGCPLGPEVRCRQVGQLGQEERSQE